MRRLLAGLLVLVVLPASAAAARAGDWQAHRSSAGFTVSTPATWVDFTRVTPQLLARIRTDPKLQAYIDLLKQTKAIKLLAVEMGSSTGFASNLNVAVTPTIGDARLQADATAAQLRSLGFLVGTTHEQVVRLPAGSSVQLDYRARYATGGQVVSITQYFLVHAGSAVILTYTTLPKLEARYRPIFTRSARTLRLR